MKKFIAIFFLLCFSFGCAKEPLNYSQYEVRANDLDIRKTSQDLLLTELDDMRDLFPFNERLDPQDPSHCVETIAKKQQEEFLNAQREIDLLASPKK